MMDRLARYHLNLDLYPSPPLRERKQSYCSNETSSKEQDMKEELDPI